MIVTRSLRRQKSPFVKFVCIIDDQRVAYFELQKTLAKKPELLPGSNLVYPVLFPGFVNTPSDHGLNQQAQARSESQANEPLRYLTGWSGDESVSVRIGYSNSTNTMCRMISLSFGMLLYVRRRQLHD